MINEYVKKPTKIKAIQYTNSNKSECLAFAKGSKIEQIKNNSAYTEYWVLIMPGEENIVAMPGDYIINEDGKYKVLSEKLFKESYIEYEPIMEEFIDLNEYKKYLKKMGKIFKYRSK